MDYLKLAEECGGIYLRGVMRMNASALARLIARVRAEAVPTGWKLVPVEPTPEMCGILQWFDRGSPEQIDEGWQQVLAAAPALPEQPQ